MSDGILRPNLYYMKASILTYDFAPFRDDFGDFLVIVCE